MPVAAAVAAMRQSLQQAKDQAGIDPTDIHCISTHGAGTKENDSTETEAIRKVFAEHATASRPAAPGDSIT